MKIKVLSRQTMEEFKSDENHIVISISDPNSEKVKIISRPFDILSLQFHDVDKPLVKRSDCTRCDGTGILPQFLNINDGHCYSCTTMLDIKLFTDKDAQQILNFIHRNETLYNRNKTSNVIVHCEAGISRSAGVAGALSLIYNGSDQYYFDKFLPNMFVYRKILNIYMRNKNEKI